MEQLINRIRHGIKRRAAGSKVHMCKNSPSTRSAFHFSFHILIPCISKSNISTTSQLYALVFPRRARCARAAMLPSQTPAMVKASCLQSHLADFYLSNEQIAEERPIQLQDLVMFLLNVVNASLSCGPRGSRSNCPSRLLTSCAFSSLPNILVFSFRQS